MREKKVTLLDMGILLLFLTVLVSSFYFLWNKNKAVNGKAVVVIDSAQGQEVYPLETDARYFIEGPLGITSVCVKNNVVFFEDSPCPEKTCIYHAPIGSGGQWAACLPNQVMIHIESHEQKLDAISE